MGRDSLKKGLQIPFGDHTLYSQTLPLEWSFIFFLSRVNTYLLYPVQTTSMNDKEFHEQCFFKDQKVSRSETEAEEGKAHQPPKTVWASRQERVYLLKLSNSVCPGSFFLDRIWIRKPDSLKGHPSSLKSLKKVHK